MSTSGWRRTGGGEGLGSDDGGALSLAEDDLTVAELEALAAAEGPLLDLLEEEGGGGGLAGKDWAGSNKNCLRACVRVCVDGVKCVRWVISGATSLWVTVQAMIAHTFSKTVHCHKHKAHKGSFSLTEQ